MSATAICPCCFAEQSDEAFIVLSCSHLICYSCAGRADEVGLASCPLCRQPHTLDTEALRSRAAEYRRGNSQWRMGAHKGSHGELADITRPGLSSTKGLGLHSESAGDLAVLGESCGSLPAPSKEVKSVLDSQFDAQAPLGFAIVGMGRAGKIHLKVLQKAREDASVLWLVDTNPEGVPPAEGAKVTAEVADALADERVDCVIVSTPTPWHAVRRSETRTRAARGWSATRRIRAPLWDSPSSAPPSRRASTSSPRSLSAATRPRCASSSSWQSAPGNADLGRQDE